MATFHLDGHAQLWYKILFDDEGELTGQSFVIDYMSWKTSRENWLSWCNLDLFTITKSSFKFY